MNWKEQPERLHQVALGVVAPDTIIKNGVVFNVFTREFIEDQSLWIRDGMIAYVGPPQDPPRNDETRVIDAGKMVLLPGLIDGHTHVFNRSCIEEFVRYVIPSGVTTVVTETIELATVVGEDGIEYVARGLREQPIRFYYTVPPLCGLTEAEEVNACTPETFRRFLEDPMCLGLGEVYWANMLTEGSQGERVRNLASMALEFGKRVEGHSAGATGRKLQAYTCHGVSSCHEPISEEEVMERLRLGYWVMVREGGVRKELASLKNLFAKDIDYRRLILVTDSADPEEFVESGYLDAVVRNALALGVRPEILYQMVTLNVAEHFRLDDRIGSLSPGKLADLVMIPSPDDFSPQFIMCGGRVIFEDGRPTAAPKAVRFPDAMFDTVKIRDTRLPPPPNTGKVRAMELITRLVTQERIVDLEDPEDSRNLNMALAMNRTGTGEAFMGFLNGFGLKQGACGSTMCWDTVAMIVVGSDVESMTTCIRRLVEIHGGAVYAMGGEVVAEIPAPLAGFISMKPMETLHQEIRRLEAALRTNGVPWEKPLLTIDTLATAAIPHLRITDRGYVRLKDKAVLPLEV